MNPPTIHPEIGAQLHDWSPTVVPGVCEVNLAGNGCWVVAQCWTGVHYTRTCDYDEENEEYTYSDAWCSELLCPYNDFVAVRGCPEDHDHIALATWVVECSDCSFQQAPF